MSILSDSEKVLQQITKISAIHLSLNDQVISKSKSIYCEIQRKPLQKNNSILSESWLEKYKQMEIVQQVI